MTAGNVHAAEKLTALSVRALMKSCASLPPLISAASWCAIW